MFWLDCWPVKCDGLHWVVLHWKSLAYIENQFKVSSISLIYVATLGWDQVAPVFWPMLVSVAVSSAVVLLNVL